MDLYGGTIYGYSATEVDYWTSYDYSAYVDGELYDQNGTLLNAQWDEEDFIAQVNTSASANPGTVYTEVGYHDVIARYYYEDIEKSPEGCMPCDGCNTDCYYYYDNWWWYDPFGFSFTNPGYYGPWWDVYGFGPYTEIENDETIYLGQTSQSLQTPPRVDRIQYQSGSSYVDISGTLYVLKGTSVTFRALPDPSTAQFPSNKPTWSGSSGAAGTGQTTSVTFNSVSSSTGDYKTVIASSFNSVAVNVIVFDLNGVLTPEETFTGRSNVRFGVKEIVDLSYTVSPSISPSQMGGIGWVLTSGDGTVSASSEGAGTYNAPGFATDPVLKLAVNSGPSQNQGPSYNVTVVQPSGAYAIQKPSAGLRHTYGMLGVGTYTLVFLTPTDVSFTNVAFSEGTATATAHGFWVGLNGATHNPQGPFSITSCNITDGCLAFEDSIDTNDWSGPFSTGDFTWNIPWRYVFGAPVQVYVNITTATHNQTADATGRATIQKAGAGPFARELNDPNSVASP